MLSKKAKYALRACLFLAKRHGEGPVLISELASKERIPRKFLEQILLELKNRGILLSKKGKGGGYLLARRPDSVTMGEILRIVEGPLAPTPCVSQTAYRRCDDCPDERTCAIRAVMKDVRDETARVLDNATLETALRRAESLIEEDESALVYHI